MLGTVGWLGTAGMLLTVSMLGTVGVLGMFGKLGHSTLVEPPLTRTVLRLGLYQASPPSVASCHKNLSEFLALIKLVEGARMKAQVVIIEEKYHL